VTGTTYEIRVSGMVPEDLLAEFGEVQVMTTHVSTVLSGDLADQAALLGVLARLRASGLDVLEVRRILAAAVPGDAEAAAVPGDAEAAAVPGDDEGE
jgi:hypothetical protein